jgi:hypothetical protein
VLSTLMPQVAFLLLLFAMQILFISNN